ncbi:MAG: four helix bundle protein [Candidatus Marinimicrobia bacterium]|nr:four helix bundle protein [Candidatus Neomarinimicrobiota bacterium]
MDEEQLKKRTEEFAHRCVKLAFALPDSVLGKHIQKQLIRCGTSVAANYRAACVAQSKPSFIHKLGIVVEESDESCFWLDFIIREKLMGKEKIYPLLKEANELIAIFISSRKTARKNN